METEAKDRTPRERTYGVKKHHATRLHYDLRLEFNGVLLSWALPEGPSCCAGAICEAIEMEDHRRANLPFEGVHETGPIMLWDRGSWVPHPECEDIESSLRRGILRFTLRGEKLRGAWMLVRPTSIKNARRPIWTLCKEPDSFAGSLTDKCILEALPNSVSTGRTMEEIVLDWTSPKNKHERQTKLFDEI
jgi:bifunctional non-homologous end joining protein LigD